MLRSCPGLPRLIERCVSSSASWTESSGVAYSARVHGYGADTDEPEADPTLVTVCREVRAGQREPDAFDAEFAHATVFVQRLPDRPGVVASVLPGKGRWVLAFSTPQRLARQCGDVPWLGATGADLLQQLPHGLGVLVDVGDEHGLPLLPQPGGPARFGGAKLPPRPAARNAVDSDSGG